MLLVSKQLLTHVSKLHLLLHITVFMSIYHYFLQPQYRGLWHLFLSSLFKRIDDLELPWKLNIMFNYVVM